MFSPGRLGAAAAYNYGVAQASGEYVARQDFDDRSYPDRLRLQAAFLDAHPEVGMVGGSYLLVDERRGERYVRMPPTRARGHHPGHGQVRSHRPHRRDLSAAGVERGRADIRWPNNLIDLRFYLRVAKLGWRFANVPEVVGEHYVHDSSWFHRSLKYVERQRDLARVQAQAVRELGLPRWMYLFSVGRHAYAYIPTRPEARGPARLRPARRSGIV